MCRFKVYLCTQLPFPTVVEEANLADDAWNDTCSDENIELEMDSGI